MAKLSLVVALCVLTSGLVAAREYAPVVQIEQGKVRGLVVEVENGEKVNFYQGIRYGKNSFYNYRMNNVLNYRPCKEI